MKIVALFFFLSTIFWMPVTSIAQNRDNDMEATLQHKGKTRTFYIHLPPTFYQSSNKYPLVIALHGGGGTANDFIRLTHLNETADSANFIVVYPDGLKNPSGLRTWNAGKCCAMNAVLFKTDDVGFIADLIDTMIARYRVNAKMVYATGHSNGAMLCYRLANELSAKITAIAPNAGTFAFTEPYNPARNVPVLHIHSKMDSILKFNGGDSKRIMGLQTEPVEKCLNIIAAKAGCAPQKKLVASYPLYSIYQWTNCSPNFDLLLYLTNDGGHSWPGGKKRLLPGHDSPSGAFNNNAIIWDFFKRFTLP